MTKTGKPFTVGLGVYFAKKAKGVPQGLSPNHVAVIGILLVYNQMAFGCTWCIASFV